MFSRKYILGLYTYKNANDEESVMFLILKL
jgi:hypothetical protein